MARRVTSKRLGRMLGLLAAVVVLATAAAASGATDDSEAVAVGDTVATSTGAVVDVGEGVGVGDRVATLTGQVASVTEGVGVGDAISVEIGQVVNVGEGVAVGDGTDVRTGQIVGITEGVIVDDGTDAHGVNIVPELSLVALTGTEGSAASSTSSFSDADDTSWTGTVDYGDGSNPEPLNITPARTFVLGHVYDDNGTYTITVTISDGKPGGTDTDTTTAEIGNDAPTAQLANNGPVSEGSHVTLTFSNQHDPSNADTAAGFQYRYACDAQVFGPATTSPTASCTAGDGPADQAMAARIIDKDGGTTDYTTMVRVENAAPDGTLSNNGPVDEGSPATISWSGQSDSQADINAGFTYRYACDGVTLGAPTNDPTTTCTYDDGPSTHTVLSQIIDRDGASIDKTTVVTVKNVAPHGTFVAPTQALDEGTAFTLALQNTGDPSQADTAAGFTVLFDCGDGAGFAATSSCKAIDNPTQTVKARITDRDGGSSTYSATFQVRNVAPSVTIKAPPSGSLYAVGQPVTFKGAFTDPGVKDTHTALWTFDSIIGSGAVTESQGNGSVQMTYAFATPGVYTVSLTVTDKDGASASASTVDGLPAFVVVYDPSAGFVTGGGWLTSPVGAYRPAPWMTGKATFGFESKYKKGATTPSGTTEFQFNAVGFNFHSTSYQWLVVAGSKAQFKGTGDVNGQGGYGFILTAYDGSPDRLRMKVWDASGAIVYDNVLGSSDDIDNANPQDLGGGSIIIHK